jgi:Ion channel
MPEPTHAEETESVPERVAEALGRRKIRRFSAIEFFVVLVLWLMSSPFVWPLAYGQLIESVLATLVLLSAVLAVGGRRRTLIAAILLVIPALVAKWLHHWRPDLVPPEIFSAAGIVFVGFVAVHLLRFVLRATRVDTEVLCAGVSIYLLAGVLWAFAYILVAQVFPGAFVFTVGPASGRVMHGLEAMYFSFVTLSTLGYGDVIPTSNVTRMLATAEATTGMFYMTVLIARLVSLYSWETRTPNRTRSR